MIDTKNMIFVSGDPNPLGIENQDRRFTVVQNSPTNSIEEGDKCPECGAGEMVLPEVENCSCHISPPCNACVDNPLTCDSCGYEYRE